jgi:hypothetical protein
LRLILPGKGSNQTILPENNGDWIQRQLLGNPIVCADRSSKFQNPVRFCHAEIQDTHKL